MTTRPRETYGQDVLDALRRRFDEAPEHPPAATEFTKLALVRELAPRFKEMNQRGYSWDAIAALFSKDVPISADLLKSYLREATARATKSKDKPRAGSRPYRKRSSSEESAAPSASSSPPPPPSSAPSPPGPSSDGSPSLSELASGVDAAWEPGSPHAPARAASVPASAMDAASTTRRPLPPPRFAAAGRREGA